MLGWKEERRLEFQLLRPWQLAPRPRTDLPPQTVLRDDNMMIKNEIIYDTQLELPIRIVGLTTLTVSNKLRPSRPGDLKMC